MVFLDSNVPMYLVGSTHPNKSLALLALRRLAAQGDRIVTDAEVFQEIVHRYKAIARPEAIQPAFDVLSKAVDDVFPIDLRAVEEGKDLSLAYPSLSARDAIHVAVMNIVGVQTILSFDTGFDQVPGITRIQS